jgi:predicted lipoprotein
VEFPILRRVFHQVQPRRDSQSLKNNDNFELARSLQWRWRGPDGRTHTQKGKLPILAIFAPGRETATALAAAFVTAMLFISSATSVLPLA